ncbi:MAG TPA: carboxymuconolactone decarboxylase family protein [Acidimicrobiales bacterium]|nr:carboxymuconolactone decarboxylase family protein [Acidimicrobiales bacterium]
MYEYLPEIYQSVSGRYPEVVAALGQVARAAEAAGPLDERSRRLVKLAASIGAGAQGAVRSSARKALEAGATSDELHQVALLAITTCGFPAAVASIGWIDEVCAVSP